MPGWCAAGSRRSAARVLQPGNAVARRPGAARLRRASRHLRLRAAARLMRRGFSTIPTRLACLAAAAALVAAALPEREPHPRCLSLVRRRCSRRSIRRSRLGRRAMSAGSCDLLAALGFGLDLTRCAATGATDDLAYVSPRTGPRGVARRPARPIATSCCRCPAFCARQRCRPTGAEIAAGLRLDRLFPRAPRLRAAWPQLPARARLLTAAADRCIPRGDASDAPQRVSRGRSERHGRNDRRRRRDPRRRFRRRARRALSLLCAVDDHVALAAGCARRAEAGASPHPPRDAASCASIPARATRNARASSAT